ncbi:hypothetical protein SLEP1_g53706 [Rubroshorea leprosula]|uniref:Uncharacterized protein n=1 Tax=Rubroshorea leprosula TaxID=152421 RepID=A0AAV5MA36_9ROSI|nr:hypothetical protein SLEP1_g53706 [Rubroshorea leprosula]
MLLALCQLMNNGNFLNNLSFQPFKSVCNMTCSSFHNRL